MDKLLKAKKRISVTATMPVSAALYGNVKKTNIIAVRRNGPRNRSRQLCYILLAFCLFFVIGCESTSKHYYVRQQIDYSSIKRAAVLPFEPLTSDEYAGEKIR